ncbi:MAG: hypothetical protein ACRD2H_12195 [Terriglobales bacterium]
MVSRIVNCTIDPEQVSGFKAALNDHFLPRIQALPGFVENIESLDPSSGKYCCVTVWQSSADEQRYGEGLFQEIARALTPMLKDAPRVETLPVENSSTQHVVAGQAVA